METTDMFLLPLYTNAKRSEKQTGSVSTELFLKFKYCLMKCLTCNSSYINCIKKMKKFMSNYKNFMSGIFNFLVLKQEQ